MLLKFLSCPIAIALPKYGHEAEMSTHLESEHVQEGVSRRGVMEAVVAGAAASIATPSPAQQQTAVLAEATDADYAHDPTRWGSEEVAALFPGFRHLDLRTRGAVIRVRHGGAGPPLPLLHGNPVNHVTWYAIAARLAKGYHVAYTIRFGPYLPVHCQSLGSNVVWQDRHRYR